MQTFAKDTKRGNKYISKNEWDHAIGCFSAIIRGITPTTDDEALCLGESLASRVICYLAKKEFDHAEADIEEMFKLYTKMRPREMQTETTHEQLQKDPLTKLLSTAQIRRGMLLELQAQYRDALMCFSYSLMLYPKSDAMMRRDAVLQEIGIVPIPRDNPELAPYQLIFEGILEDDVLNTGLNALEAQLVSKPPREYYQLVNDSGCCRLLVGVMQLVVDDLPMVSKLLLFCRVLLGNGCIDVIEGLGFFAFLFRRYKTEVSIVSEIIRIIGAIPPMFNFASIAPYNFTAIFMNSLKTDIGLQRGDIELTFVDLYRLTAVDAIASVMLEHGIVDIIFAHRDIPDAFMLLSKMSNIDDGIDQLMSRNGLEWAYEFAESNNTELVIAMTHVLLVALQKVENPAGIAPRAVDLAAGLLTKLKKVPHILANSFAIIGTAAHLYTPPNLKEVLVAGPVMMSLHIEDREVVENALYFIYHEIVAGHKDTLAALKGLLPTTAKALEKFQNSQMVAEYGLGVFLAFGVPRTPQLLREAARKFKDSKLLEKFVTDLSAIENKH